MYCRAFLPLLTENQPSRIVTKIESAVTLVDVTVVVAFAVGSSGTVGTHATLSTLSGSGSLINLLADGVEGLGQLLLLRLDGLDVLALQSLLQSIDLALQLGLVVGGNLIAHLLHGLLGLIHHLIRVVAGVHSLAASLILGGILLSAELISRGIKLSGELYTVSGVRDAILRYIRGGAV